MGPNTARAYRKALATAGLLDGPVEVAQVDFGAIGKLWDPETGRMREAYVFVFVLGYSRHMAVRIVVDQ